MIANRLSLFLLLIVVGFLLFLPGSGACSLWDVDEAHNAECAREMFDSGNWVVPTFNFALRSDKPALLYWIMMIFYGLIGVSDFAARLGSTVFGIGTLLVTSELGRRMFDAKTGILAGIVLSTSVMFCVSSRAATPDALLIFWVAATMLVFWISSSAGGRGWLIGCGLTMALAVLAKGAVGLLLPMTILTLFLLWERRLHLLWDRRLLWGVVLFCLVALPWYVAVGIETKGAFLRGFFWKHHVERFQQPMEGHAGSVFYHPLVFLVTFSPWSAFLGATVWSSTGRRMANDCSETSATAGSGASAYRLLWCWIGVWFVFFSLAGTKLPNYTLPAFPAVALLTARFLTRWADGKIGLPGIWMVLGFVLCSLMGAAITAGLIVAAGKIPQIPLEGRTFPELLQLVPLGFVLLSAGCLSAWLVNRERRWAAVACVAVASVITVGGLAATGPGIVARQRAPYALAQAVVRHQVEDEVEIACLDFYQPSLVWYTQRHIARLDSPRAAIDHLHSVKQTYLVTPRGSWDQFASRIEGPVAVLAAAWDFMANQEIVLVSNRPPIHSSELLLDQYGATDSNGLPENPLARFGRTSTRLRN